MSLNPEKLHQFVNPVSSSEEQPIDRQRSAKPIPLKLPIAVLVGGLGLNLLVCSVDPTSLRTLRTAMPTPITTKGILIPLPEGENRCPNGSLPVITKDNAFCRR